MFAKVMCPGCKYQFSIPEGDMGKRQVCPNCRSPFIAGKSETDGAGAAAPVYSAPASSGAQPALAKTMLGETGPSVKYNCPRCKAPLESPVSEAGVKKPCPACGQRLQVPNPPPPTASSPAMAPPRLDKTMLASDERAAPALPPIKYNCPNCKRPLEAPAIEASTKKNCPSCGQRHQIPAAPSPAGGPNLNKTMLAGDGSNPQPAAGAAYASYTTPGAAPAAGAPTPATPMIAGVPLNGKNIAIAAGILLLLLYVVPALIRGGKGEDANKIAEAKAKFDKEMEKYNKDKEELAKEVAQRKLDLDRQELREKEARREQDALLAKYNALEQRLRDEHRETLRDITDVKLKASLEEKFRAAEARFAKEKAETEKAQQKLLEEATARLNESKKALEAAQQKTTIIQQPAQVVVPPVYYPPYDPYYWRPWWAR